MNKDLFKILFVLVTAPVWLPFARALIEEFIAAMRGDGGFKGPTTTPAQRKEIQEEIDRQEAPRVVIEPLAHILLRQGLRPGEQAQDPDSEPESRGPAKASSGPKQFRT